MVQKKGRLFGNKPDYIIAIFGAGKFLEIFLGIPSQVRILFSQMIIFAMNPL